MRIDGRVVERASALVRAGQVLSFPLDEKIMVVRVEGLAERRGPYVEARHMYTDLALAGAGVSQPGVFAPALCQEALTQGAASF